MSMIIIVGQGWQPTGPVIVRFGYVRFGLEIYLVALLSGLDIMFKVTPD